MPADTRAPWDPPEWLGDPVATWLAARAISDEPEVQWTFPIFVWRAVAVSPTGLDFGYEFLESWEETTAALLVQRHVHESGFGGSFNLHLSFGMRVFDSTLRSTTGRLALPEPSEHFRGRHWVSAVAWDQTKDEIVFPNSWGFRWGDGGVGYIREEYFNAHVDSVILNRPTWMGSSPAMDEKMKTLAWRRGTPGQIDQDIYAEAWHTPNRIKAKTVMLNDGQHDIRRRMLYTFAKGLPFDIVEIREGEDLRGRLHLVHDLQSRLSTATELWVPPSSRRGGYGTYLLSLAEELASGVSSQRLRFLLHEADAGELGRGRATAFAESAGLQWTWNSTSLPVTVGYAQKTIPEDNL